MAVTLSSLAGAGAQLFNNSGVPLAGGLIYTYLAGTTTPATAYTSNTGLTAHSNPIVLDSAGRVSSGEIWLTSGVNYKFTVETSTSVLIGTYDNIPSINDFTTIYSELANTANPALGDALVGFRQSNASGNLSGSVGRTVHQKLQEIVSVLDFGAVGDGVTDDTVAIQAALDASAYVVFPAGQTFKTTATLTVPTTCYHIDGVGAYMTGPGYASAVDGFYFTGFQQGPSTYPTWHEAFRSRNYSLPGLTKYRYGVSIVDAAFLNIQTELISFCTSGLRIEATAGATSWAVQNIFNASLIVNCTNAVDLVVVEASVEGIQGCTIAIEYISGCNNGFLGTFLNASANIFFNIFKVGTLDGNGAANNPVYTYANAINFNIELTANINSWLFDNDPINMVASVGVSPYINVGLQEIVQAGRFIGLSFAPFQYDGFLPGGFRTTSRPAFDLITIYVDQSLVTTGNGSAASPYKTIAEAVDALFEMDGFGRTAQIQLVAGTYSEVVSVNTDSTGNGNWELVIAGVASTPASVTMTGGITITGATVTLQDLTVTTNGILAVKSAYVNLNRVNFGAVATAHIDAETNGIVEIISNYTISGAAAIHAQTGYNGQFLCMGKTVTITGTPAFSSYFAFANKLSYQDYTGTTFSGSATGVRALVNLNSAINTNGGGANFLPGNSAVVTTNGGQYV